MMRGEGGVAAGTEEATEPEILLVLETTTGTEKEKETETGIVAEIGIAIEEKETGTEGKVGTVIVTVTTTAIPRTGAGSEVSTWMTPTLLSRRNVRRGPKFQTVARLALPLETAPEHQTAGTVPVTAEMEIDTRGHLAIHGTSSTTPRVHEGTLVGETVGPLMTHLLLLHALRVLPQSSMSLFLSVNPFHSLINRRPSPSYEVPVDEPYNPDEPKEDDSEARSVFVSQLAARLTARDLGYFFEDKLGDGTVMDSRIVTDRLSRRSKGY